MFNQDRKMKDCATTDEMRAEISRTGNLYDPTVHAVDIESRMVGRSGEDKYVHLAYQLLRRLHVMEDQLLDQVHRTIGGPPIFLKDEDKPRMDWLEKQYVNVSVAGPGGLKQVIYTSPQSTVIPNLGPQLRKYIDEEMK